MANAVNLGISGQEKKTIQGKKFFGSGYVANCTILYLSGIWEHASLLNKTMLD